MEKKQAIMYYSFWKIQGFTDESCSCFHLTSWYFSDTRENRHDLDLYWLRIWTSWLHFLSMQCPAWQISILWHGYFLISDYTYRLPSRFYTHSYTGHSGDSIDTSQTLCSSSMEYWASHTLIEFSVVSAVYVQNTELNFSQKVSGISVSWKTLHCPAIYVWSVWRRREVWCDKMDWQIQLYLKEN